MADKVSSKVRSRIMSRIQKYDSKPELLVRRELWRRGYRYRLYAKLPGTPDLIFARARVVVFINGCFSHGCPKHYRPPKSRREYWIPKLERNKARDKAATGKLRRMGWCVLTIWECDAIKAPQNAADKIAKKVDSRIQYGARPLRPTI